MPLAVSLAGGNRGRRHPTRAAARQDPRRRGPGRQTPADASKHSWPTAATTMTHTAACSGNEASAPWSRKEARHTARLGIFRYVVERTIAWLHGFRRPRIRWERRDDIHKPSSALPPA
ncbi:hypothetical protein AB0D84_29255 [Streptomyces sp. NPDC048193]|uniref:hypothetical protein n=1 Tax=unclassified Streptomyces TaxID=2593676 RepID=UPI003449DA88